MTSELTIAKRPANVMRAYTARVRDHAAAMGRAQEQYFATLKRAEATYFDAIRRITDTITSETPEVGESSNGDTTRDESELLVGQ